MGQDTQAPGRRFGDYRQAFRNLAQAPRWRGLIAGTISLLLLLWIWKANVDPNTPGSRLYQQISGKSQKSKDYIWKAPSALEPTELTLDLESGKSSTAPSHLRKENPQFHLLIHAPKITGNVCRSLLSSFLLDYPPPTLIGYRPERDSNDTKNPVNFWLENGIPDTAKFMADKQKVQDDDVVLLVDGESTMFQLPTEALLTEYNLQTKRANEALGQEFGDVPVKNDAGKKLQRFNQSALFATEYEMVYKQGKSFLSRFRVPHAKQEAHLNKNLVIGTGSAIRRLFTTAAEQNTRIVRTDTETFNTMYAQQHLVRDKMAQEQRPLKSWLSRNLLPTNKKLKKLFAQDYAAAKKDLGIGMDRRGAIFQVVPPAAQHVTGTIIRLKDGAAGFPVPHVFKDLRRPFAIHQSTPHINSTNAVVIHMSEDNLPVAEDWTTIPLFTNPVTQQIPALISVITNHDSTAEADNNLLVAPDTNVKEVWSSLWFYPHARTLLQQYLQKSTSKEFASEAAVGGERWWDVRGGRGGAWTDDGEWLSAAELCAPFGGELFADGKQGWPSAVTEDAGFGESGTGPDGKGTYLGEVVKDGEVVKVVLLPPQGQEEKKE